MNSGPSASLDSELLEALRDQMSRVRPADESWTSLASPRAGGGITVYTSKGENLQHIVGAAAASVGGILGPAIDNSVIVSRGDESVAVYAKLYEGGRP